MGNLKLGALLNLVFIKNLLLFPGWHCGAALKEIVMWKRETLDCTHSCITISTFYLGVLSQMKNTKDHEIDHVT